MFSGKSLKRKKKTEKVIEEILSSISFPLLCGGVNSDRINLEKVIPINHSAVAEFQGTGSIGGQYSAFLTLSDQMRYFILKMKFIPLRPSKL